jgi:hypothetical protein
MASPWQICDKTVVALDLGEIPPLPRETSGSVIDLSLLQRVDAMNVPSNRTASGFAVRQEETWVDFVH